MNDLVPKNKELALPGFKISSVGAVANKGLTLDQWEDALHVLSHIERRFSWVLGDVLLSLRGKWEQGSLEEICERFGIAYQTANNASYICRAFEELSRRRDNLTYGHHAEVANRDDADELLDWCEDHDASIKDLREEKKRRAKIKRLEMADSLPDGQYSVIYADPPWQYTSGDQHTSESQETVLGTHYPSMPLDEICDLPVGDMAADNSVLFLWVTSPLADEAFEVVTAWGFEYKSSFVWDKVKHNVGNYNSMRHEFLYVCTKGTCPPQNVKLFDSVQSIERTKHSEKPEEFRKIIETLYPRGKKIELFARKKTKGWKVWGNET